MIESIITRITQLVQTLNKKELQKYLIALLGCMLLIVGGISYYIYTTSSSLAHQLKQINTLSAQARYFIKQNDQMAEEMQYIRTLLDKNKGFNISTDFEEFCKTHNVTAEAGWKAEIEERIEGSDFEEVVLRATFKNQNMQTLVTLLSDVYKKEMVYLKGLEILNENKKITFELTLATKQYKTETQEAEVE